MLLMRRYSARYTLYIIHPRTAKVALQVPISIGSARRTVCKRSEAMSLNSIGSGTTVRNAYALIEFLILYQAHWATQGTRGSRSFKGLGPRAGRRLVAMANHSALQAPPTARGLLRQVRVFPDAFTPPRRKGVGSSWRRAKEDIISSDSRKKLI